MLSFSATGWWCLVCCAGLLQSPNGDADKRQHGDRKQNAEQQDADKAARTKKAFALLRGVREARLKVQSGRLTIAGETRHFVSDYSPPPFRLQAEFSGKDRRFVHFERTLSVSDEDGEGEQRLKKLKQMGSDQEAFVKAGLGWFIFERTRSVFDGNNLMKCNEEPSATIHDPKRAGGDYNFDPRVFGISVWNGVADSVDDLAGKPDDVRTIELLGREKINGRLTWKVQVVHRHDQKYTYWIEDVEGFPVHRVELRTKFQRQRVTSLYVKEGAAWPLPECVLIESFKSPKLKQLYYETAYKVIKAELGVEIDPKLFGFDGLEMPVGTPVTDIRIKRRIGYWDGEKLTKFPKRIPRRRM